MSRTSRKAHGCASQQVKVSHRGISTVLLPVPVRSSSSASYAPIRNIRSSARYLGFPLSPHCQQDAISRGSRHFAPCSGTPSARLHLGYYLQRPPSYTKLVPDARAQCLPSQYSPPCQPNITYPPDTGLYDCGYAAICQLTTAKEGSLVLCNRASAECIVDYASCAPRFSCPN